MSLLTRNVLLWVLQVDPQGIWSPCNTFILVWICVGESWSLPSLPSNQTMKIWTCLVFTSLNTSTKSKIISQIQVTNGCNAKKWIYILLTILQTELGINIYCFKIISQLYDLGKHSIPNSNTESSCSQKYTGFWLFLAVVVQRLLQRMVKTWTKIYNAYIGMRRAIVLLVTAFMSWHNHCC